MSLFFGVVVNSLLCIPIGWRLAFLREIWAKVLLIVFSPLIAAYALYWIAVMLKGGDQSGEYGSWSGLFIIAWALPSYLALFFGYTVGRSQVRRNRAAANK